VCLNDLKNTIMSLTLLGNNGNVGVDISTEQINDCDDDTDADNMLKCNNFPHRINIKIINIKTEFNYFVHSSCLDGNVQYQGTLSERSLQ
jgi:hypothetical protein